MIAKEVEVGNDYVNLKTGETYIVLHISKAAWDIKQRLVVYAKQTEGPIWVRSLNDFIEKFVKSVDVTFPCDSCAVLERGDCCTAIRELCENYQFYKNVNARRMS